MLISLLSWRRECRGERPPTTGDFALELCGTGAVVVVAVPVPVTEVDTVTAPGELQLAAPPEPSRNNGSLGRGKVGKYLSRHQKNRRTDEGADLTFQENFPAFCWDKCVSFCDRCRDCRGIYCWKSPPWTRLDSSTRSVFLVKSN